MSHRARNPRWRTAATAGTALLVSALGLSAMPAHAAPAADGPATPVPAASHRVQLPTGKLGPLDRGDGARHAVFVQFRGKGAAQVSARALDDGRTKAAARRAAIARQGAVAVRATSVLQTARSHDSRVRRLFQVSNALPGMAIEATGPALRAVAARSDVKKVTPLVPKTVSNAGAAQLTRVLDTWRDLGNTGRGVRIGVIDTGIDYTHADFGGPGTVAAWDAAHTASADPGWRSSLPALARAKVAGGHDFVGDDYDADPASDTYQPMPHPDANPLDCDGHGTHVSGTAAGYGVNADGSPFRGDYGSLTGSDLYRMKIGPGMAPSARLYGLKVFGCTGSTDVVIPALDWALDPNGDGRFSDHLDIVNLSLGSDYSAVDDPENAVVDRIAKLGVLPVISMGNNGDLTDTGGSPGNAVRSLAVASSVDQYQLLDGLRVDAPASVAGVVGGQVSVAYPWANAPDVTGDVVALSAANADGCEPLSTADAATVSGKIAWLAWDSDDTTRRCGSAGRSNNVLAAGAIGALFDMDQPTFNGGITGSADIPVLQLTQASSQLLRPALEAGTLEVTFDSSLLTSVRDIDNSIADLASGFTSRGPHGSIGVVKPDVAAPGDTIASAKIGSGFEPVSESGTSMASPHTAGIAALVKSAHRSWTPEQVKADIMNTAGHDVFTKQNRQGLRYAPARVGAGRVDARSALGNTLLVYNTDRRGGVSASFGVVPVPITQPRSYRARVLRLQNTGNRTVTASLRYDPVVSQPGVTYRVTPSRVRVPAHRSVRAVVTMTVVTSALRRTIDPTMATTQIGAPRQFVADASGRVLVTPSGGTPLRVPVYGAAKPTAAVSASASRSGDGIALRGRGVSQGSGSEAYTSLVSVLELGARSPRLPRCHGDLTTGCTVNQTAVAGDLQYVGAGSSGDYLWFGISTYADWANIGNTTIPYVDFDTTGDGQPDYEVYVQNYPSTDVLLAALVDLGTGEVVDLEPVNFQFGDVDTNVFDSNVLLIPVLKSLVGLEPGAKSFPISYTVGMNSVYTNNASGDIDSVGPVRFDPVTTPLATGSPLFVDEGGSQIPLPALGGGGYGYGSRRADALVLHLHGASGARAQVLRLER